MKDALMLLRPLQWFKNAFVFAPLFFSNNLLNKEYFVQTFWTFLAFCLVSSSIYCFNDIHDVESDRLHPKKKLRPIAAGKVSIWLVGTDDFPVGPIPCFCQTKGRLPNL